MYDQARQVPGRPVPIHRWLFALAIGLTVVAVPYAAVVYAEHLPTAWLNLNMAVALGLWIFAEMRRESWKRSRIQGELSELVAAVEQR